MVRKLIPIADAHGKTVTGTVWGRDDQSLVIMFDADSAVLIRATRESDPTIEIDSDELRPADCADIGMANAVLAELIDADVADAFLAEKRRRSTEHTEREERATLERLRKKYG